MKTLEQHNQEMRLRYKEINEPHPNGIECPKCKLELRDSDPRELLTSYPAQKRVHCPACGYTGYRIA